MSELDSGYGYSEAAPPIASPGEGAESAPVSNEGALVVAERTPVSDNTNDLTAKTVAKMCEYIAKGAADEHVRGCALYAAHVLGRGGFNAMANAWGVFWFLKHRVRRVLDEGNGIRFGEQRAYDILIAPDALLRMQNPQEDCDGFTMAAAAMLAALGTHTCIVSIACDPRDRERWSHVFGMVQLENGDWMPLDCSHGREPGWMVPRHRITRWQAWDLNGNPIDVPMPAVPMRGYVGLGQDVCDPTDPAYDAIQCEADTAAVSMAPSITTTPTTPSTTGGINWNSILAGILPGAIAGATKVATVAELPAGASLTSTGAVVSPYAGIASLGSFLPLIIVGVGAFLLISLMERNK